MAAELHPVPTSVAQPLSGKPEDAYLPKVGQLPSTWKDARIPIAPSAHEASGKAPGLAQCVMSKVSPERGQAMTRMYEDGTSGPFFNNVVLAPDGGISEVKDLYSQRRALIAVINLSCIGFNLYGVIYLNLKTFINHAARTEDDNKVFSFFNAIIDQMVSLEFMASMKEKDVTSEFVVAVYEMFMLGIYFVQFLALVVRSLCCSSGALYWHAVAEFVWITIGGLRSFSAMRLFGYVAPSLLTRRLSEKIGTLRHACSEEGCCARFKSLCSLILLLFKSCFFLMAGLDSFFVKQDTISKLGNNEHDFQNFLLKCQFLIQVLGIIDVNRFAQHRLAVFIFGGEDGVMSTGASDSLAVWQATLVREIWQSHSCLQFTVIMLTWSDYDFQKLVLNDRGKKDDDAPEIELQAKA